MKRAADGRLLVVCDACVLINFLLVGRPDLLTANKDYRFIIATDDRRSLTEVKRRLGSGRALTTPGILLGCIRAGSLSVEEADAIKAELERQRFTMSFSSFADLLA